MAASTTKVGLAGRELFWGDTGTLDTYPWLAKAEPMPLTLPFFLAFVKHIMAS